MKFLQKFPNFQISLAKSLSIVLIFSLVFSACQRQNEQPNPQTAQIIDKELIETLAKVTEVTNILTEVIKDDAAVEEVREGIKSAVYADERILLTDLINPETSKVKSFKAKSSEMSFGKVFRKVAESGKYRNANKNLTKSNALADLMAYIKKENVSIYWPYSENWTSKTDFPLPTLIIPQIEEANEGKGLQPSKSKALAFDEVTVNDKYANANPTWLVTTNRFEEEIIGEGGSSGGGNPTPTPVNSVVACPECTDFSNPNNIYTVQIGWVQVTNQLDNLIGLKNCGGSEIRIVKAKGALNSNGAIDAKSYELEIQFTRGEINDRHWKYVARDYELDWEVGYGRLVVACYEHDDTNSKVTASGTIQVNSSTTVTVTKTYEEGFPSNNPIQYNLDWPRNAFFELNKNPNRQLFYGFQLFTGGQVTHFTLPHLVYKKI